MEYTNPAQSIFGSAPNFCRSAIALSAAHQRVISKPAVAAIPFGVCLPPGVTLGWKPLVRCRNARITRRIAKNTQRGRPTTPQGMRLAKLID